MPDIVQFIKYIKFEKRYSTHTVDAYNLDLSQFAKFLVQKFELGLLNAEYTHIRSWVIYLGESGISKRSINRKVTSLRSFYKYYKSKGLVDNNPAAKMAPLKTPKNLPVFVEEDNMLDLFEESMFSTDYIDQLSKVLIDILYNTGIRVSELVNIKSRDVDLVNSQVKVLGKRNKERIIPISDSLITNLRKYISEKESLDIEIVDDEYFFINPSGKKIYSKFVYRKINYYLGLVTTIKKRSPHVIRHTFATHMLNKGADLNAIKEILGHSSLAATQVYTHNSIDKLKNIYKQAHPKA